MKPKTWFISDTHFMHQNVALLRGYSSYEEQDLDILDKWNSMIDYEDTVYHLGDLTMKAINNPYVWTMLCGLHGHKHLILGNHDKIHPVLKRPDGDKFREYLEFFDTVGTFSKYNDGPFQSVLSHFPYDTEEQWMQLAPKDLGKLLIHGHTHSSEKVSYSKKGTPQINVCWEAWGRPIELGEIKQLWNNIKSS